MELGIVYSPIPGSPRFVEFMTFGRIYWWISAQLYTQKEDPGLFCFPPKKTRVFTTPHFDNKGRGFTTKMKTSSKSAKWTTKPRNLSRPFWERKSFPSIRWGFVSITIRLSTRTGAAFFFWSLECPPRGGVGCWWGFVGLDGLDFLWRWRFWPVLYF